MNKRLFNNSLIIIMLVLSIKKFIELMPGIGLYKVLIIIMLLPVVLFPKFVNKVLKIEISDLVESLYLIFIFFSYYLGTIENWYYSIFIYDKIVHFVSGTMTAFLAMFIIIKTGNYQKNKVIINSIIVIMFSLSIASFWEFFEFFNDKIFSKDAQKVLTTGVDDTMKDMIYAFGGSILFVIMYILEMKKNKKLLIYNFIKGIEG